MRTPWWTSKRSRRPRRMEMVSLERSAPRPARVGSGAPGPGPSRCTCGTRPRWWPPRSAARPGPAWASGGCPRPWSPRPCPRPRWWCNSSMKRMIRPSEDCTSLSTALRRSSNSPRYLAPAMSAPHVQGEEGLVLQALGHVLLDDAHGPRPSAMAVLPTPASPMSTGLFLVRLDRMRMTRRISSSRPMTGSILPFLASSTRSRPYLARGLVGAFGIGRGDALAAADLGQGGEDAVFVDAKGLVDLSGQGRGRLVAKGQEQVFDADVFVF